MLINFVCPVWIVIFLPLLREVIIMRACTQVFCGYYKMSEKTILEYLNVRNSDLMYLQ